jgi:hypothetical protein
MPRCADDLRMDWPAISVDGENLKACQPSRPTVLIFRNYFLNIVSRQGLFAFVPYLPLPLPPQAICNHQPDPAPSSTFQSPGVSCSD